MFLLEESYLVYIFHHWIFSGSKDNTVRIWNILYGSLITVFNLHAPILDLRMTTQAHHLMVQLANSSRLPLLCFHNVPLEEPPTQSQVNLKPQQKKLQSAPGV